MLRVPAMSWQVAYDSSAARLQDSACCATWPNERLRISSVQLVAVFCVWTQKSFACMHGNHSASAGMASALPDAERTNAHAGQDRGSRQSSYLLRMHSSIMQTLLWGLPKTQALQPPPPILLTSAALCTRKLEGLRV